MRNTTNIVAFKRPKKENPLPKKENVFFTMDYVGFNKIEDTLSSKDYKSNVFIYEFNNNETLNLNKIDEILKKLDVEQKIEFIVKLFVKNKRKNRFFIK